MFAKHEADYVGRVLLGNCLKGFSLIQNFYYHHDFPERMDLWTFVLEFALNLEIPLRNNGQLPCVRT